jgi:hypothetical protein
MGSTWTSDEALRHQTSSVAVAVQVRNSAEYGTVFRQSTSPSLDNGGACFYFAGSVSSNSNSDTLYDIVEEPVIVIE